MNSLLFFAYFFQRTHQFNTIVRDDHHFQQYFVDQYWNVEAESLKYLRHQKGFLTCGKLKVFVKTHRWFKEHRKWIGCCSSWPNVDSTIITRWMYVGESDARAKTYTRSSLSQTKSCSCIHSKLWEATLNSQRSRIRRFRVKTLQSVPI